MAVHLTLCGIADPGPAMAGSGAQYEEIAAGSNGTLVAGARQIAVIWADADSRVAWVTVGAGSIGATDGFAVPLGQVMPPMVPQPGKVLRVETL